MRRNQRLNCSCDWFGQSAGAGTLVNAGALLLLNIAGHLSKAFARRRRGHSFGPVGQRQWAGDDRQPISCGSWCGVVQSQRWRAVAAAGAALARYVCGAAARRQHQRPAPMPSDSGETPVVIRYEPMVASFAEYLYVSADQLRARPRTFH